MGDWKQLIKFKYPSMSSLLIYRYVGIGAIESSVSIT